MNSRTMLWRRLDTPGHEACRCKRENGGWRLSGAAVFAYRTQACRLDYTVVCNAVWETVAASVRGWVGGQEIAIDIAADAARRWRMNGMEVSAVAGCADIDLNFSPATNLLPIRRLGLAVGGEAAVKAAWLRFPGFTLEPLDQVYRRLDASTYRYSSAGGRFSTEIAVDGAGFVTRYPGFFHAEPLNPAATPSTDDTMGDR